MAYETLDTDELLRLALGAMSRDRDADALVMLKTLLEREPGHVYGRYLLAAQYAQLGIMDHAESGFREVVASAPDLGIARFQLGQLLLLKGASDEAVAVLEPLAATPAGAALADYAGALIAVAAEDVAGAVAGLQSGLARPQEIPALAGDMQRLLDQLQSRCPMNEEPHGTVPVRLSGYGRQG